MKNLVCPHCKIPQLELDKNGCCSWYCAFWLLHEKEKPRADIKKWMELNKLMLKEKEELKKTNRQKESLKILKKMKDQILEKSIFKMKYESTKEKGLFYTASLYRSFDHCTCEGFKYKGNCKHIEQMKKDYKLINF